MGTPREQGLVPDVHTGVGVGGGTSTPDHILAGDGLQKSQLGRRTVTSTECTTVLLFTNTQQSFKFSSFIKRRRVGEGTEKKTTQPNEPNKKEKKNIEKNKNKPRLTAQLYRSEDNRVDRVTHGCSIYINYRGGAAGRGPRARGSAAPAPTCASSRAPAPPRTPSRAPHAHTHVHTHRPARRAEGEGRRVSPVRVLLYVIIRGGTIKEARVEGLPLLPSGKDARDGAESHLLFLLFPFLVFKIL